MAELNIQRVPTLDGLLPAYDAATGSGDHIVVTDSQTRLLVHVQNGDTAQHTVTFNDVNTSTPPGAAAFDPDVTIAVPAGEDRFINLTQLDRFRDPDTGRIDIAWSAATGMTIGVFEL